MRKRMLIAGALASVGIFMLSGRAIASTIAEIEAEPTGTAGVSYGTPTDPAAVITFIGSQAGASVDGFTYSNWAILVNDGTGSLDTFGHLPSGDTYVPTVGDAITATGTYSPFDAIPEVETLTALSKVSSGNAVPGPETVTIPELNAITTTPNLSISEYLLSLDNVTLTGASVFATHANTTLTATDGLGNTVTVFQQASSYSAAGALGGTAIPAGPVDVTGIVDIFDGSTELIPFSVTAVPEPASIGMLVLGGTALLARRRQSAAR